MIEEPGKNEKLWADLEAAAKAMEDAALELFLASKTLNIRDYPVAMKRIQDLDRLADKLTGYADEVRAGQISRSTEQPK